MKRNKLYTVTKGNIKPLVRSVSNTFDWGGLAQADYQKNPWDYADDMDITQQYMNQKNWLGITKADNPFSRGNLSGGIKAMAGTPLGGSMIGALAGTVGNIGGNIISDGLSSGAGKAISSIGSTVGSAISTVNPLIGGIVSVGSGLLGGATNALWGTQTNQEKLNAANAGTAQLANFTSSATDFSGIQAPEPVATIQDPYRGGVFKKGWARRKNAALAEAREDAIDWANSSMENNIANITNNRLNNALANYSAFGGPIGPIDSVIDNDNMGAIEYGFMSDYLTQKKQAAEARNKIAGITPMPAFLPNSFAIGGDVQMNGGDFSTGSVHIDAGKSHNENPNGGVQIGVDSEGVPNLVEEGEVIFNDYVYSNRIQCDEATKNKFHIGKKRGLSYADLAKKLEKEIQERPNDPISKAGFQAQMQQLADEQERQKQEMEEERAKEAFEALSPEEKVAVMQEVSARENLAAQEQQQAIAEQQAAMQAAAAQQQPTVQPTPEEIAMAQQQQAAGVPVDAAMAQGQQEVAPVMAEGGGLKGRTLPEVVITPEVPVTPVSVVPSVTPLEVLGAMETLAQADREKKKEELLQERQEKEELHRLRALEKAQRNANKQGRVGVQPGYLDEINNSIDTRADGYYGNGQITYIPEVVITPPNVQPVQAPEMTGLPFPSGNTPQASVPPIPGLFEDPRTLPIVESPTQNNSNGLTEIKRSVGVIPEDLGAFQTRMETDFEGLNESKKKNDDIPRHRAEWLRYAGLFGPAAGLGMMAAGVGKPDYSRLDAAVAAGSGTPVTASYKPIGDYLTYNPLDVWSQQNALNAQARATDRAIQNQSSPSRMAGLLASGYNSQVASGNLFRQAQEYNDALRRQVAEFNRGTNQYNADAYTRNSQFNADALNRNRQFNAQLQMEAARQRADADAGWYNSLYGNVAGLFRGLGDIGTENYRMNRISEMAADGLFGAMGNSYLGRRVLENTRSNGGKMKKKRGLTY